MERGLSLISLTWRDGQQMLSTLGRRGVIQGTAIAQWSAQNAERLMTELSGKISGKLQKSYPSHRACPACGEKTLYQASWSTIFTGLYTRTCSVCSYCEPRKVKMIRQL